MTKKADMVDMMMALDLLGEQTNVVENRNWLFNHGFKEQFDLVDVGFSTTAMSSGFVREIWIDNNAGFKVRVKFDDGKWIGSVPFSDLCGKLIAVMKYSDDWYKVLSIADKTHIHDEFSSTSAEEAVALAVVAGKNTIQKIYELFSKSSTGISL